MCQGTPAGRATKTRCSGTGPARSGLRAIALNTRHSCCWATMWVESKAVEIDTYLFFTNDVVTRPQEEYTIRVRARWIMIVGDPDGQYMVADVGEAEPPHEHSYTQKHDAAQHCFAMICKGDNDTPVAPHVRRGGRPWVLKILRPLEHQ